MVKSMESEIKFLQSWQLKSSANIIKKDGLRIDKLVLKFLLLLTICWPSVSFALSEKDYNRYLEDISFREADQKLTSAWKKAKEIADPDVFQIILRFQREWVKKDRDIEAFFLLQVCPSADIVKRYAIVTSARADYLTEIANFLAKGGDGYEFRRFFGKLAPEDVLMRTVSQLCTENSSSESPHSENSSVDNILDHALDDLNEIKN